MDRTVTRVVHVKHLAGYILKKWRVLLLGMLIGLCAFSVVGVVTIKKSQQQSQEPIEKKKKISVTEAEFANVQGIIDYEILLAEKEEYMENSILMQIDPLHKWSCNDVYTVEALVSVGVTPENVSEKVHVLVNLFSEQSFWESLSIKTEGQMGVGYLREIVSVAVVSGDEFKVTITHVSEEQARRLGDLVEECLRDYVNGNSDFSNYNFVEVKGTAVESVDNGLIELQKNTQVQLIGVRDTLANRKYALTDGAREYLELYREAKDKADYEEGQSLEKKVVEKKERLSFSLNTMEPYIVRGIGTGLLSSIVLVLVMYSCYPCVLNPQNADELFGLRVLNDKNESLVSDAEYQLAATKIDVNIPEESKADIKVLLTGSVMDAKAEECIQKLKKEMEELGINVLESSFLREKPEEMKRLKQAQQIVLVEQLGKTRFDNLAWEVSLCEESDKPIAGIVFV